MSDPSSPASTSSTASSAAAPVMAAPVDYATSRFPFCLVWTPIPVLTWFFPMIGHMGIAMSTGIIRDFAGPYFVSEDNFAFGRPARYLQLSPAKVPAAGGGARAATTTWDECVAKASVVYGTRMHNLFCDNCHSHVGLALRQMHYDQSSSWNMVRLALWMFVCGKYVGVWGFVRTWLPFGVIFVACFVVATYL